MRPKPILVGLNSTVGKSGKDTLCNMLGDGAKRFAFADVLKERTSGMTRIPLGHFHDQSLKDTSLANFAIKYIPESDFKNFLRFGGNYDPSRPRSPRWYIQKFGTEYMRAKNADVWLDYTLGAIEGFMASAESVNCEFIVVTDMRMKNELAFIKQHGGIPLRIQRDWAEPELDAMPKHASDTDLDDCNLRVLVNHWGDQLALLEQFKEVLREHQIEL